MNSSYETPRGQIVVAVAFDSQTDAVMRSAISLARRHKLGVHLVSVVEPTLLNPWVAASSVTMPYFPIYPELDEEQRQDLIRRLQDLAGRLELPYAPTTSAPYGLKSHAIIAEAASKRANLIVTGYDPEKYVRTLGGVSTAIALLHDAPMPVLAVCKDAPADFSKRPFKILVADDFCENSHEAVLKSFELATAEMPAEIRQVHVHGDFREIIRTKWESLKARLPDAECGNLTPDSLWDDEYKSLLAKGKEHGSPFRRKAELAGVKITLDVRSGNDVGQEFRDAVEEFDPDLVVFGRHRVLRTRPFLIGRMPFRTMLQSRRSVLVVPPTAELYARLPLPGASC